MFIELNTTDGRQFVRISEIERVVEPRNGLAAVNGGCKICLKDHDTFVTVNESFDVVVSKIKQGLAAISSDIQS